MNDAAGPSKPWQSATLIVTVLAGITILAWLAYDPSVPAPSPTAPARLEPRSHPHLTVLGIGAVVLVLQLFLMHRFRRTRNRVVLTTAASIAILICTVLLATGHPAQRVRASKHDCLDAVMLRNCSSVVRVAATERATSLGQAVEVSPRRYRDQFHPPVGESVITGRRRLGSAAPARGQRCDHRAGHAGGRFRGPAFSRAGLVLVAGRPDPTLDAAERLLLLLPAGGGRASHRGRTTSASC